MTYLGALGILLGFIALCWLDIINLILQLRRNIRGRGPSAIPVVPLVFYAFFCLYTRNRPLMWNREPALVFKVFDFLALALVHFMCLIGIPWLHSRWIHRGGRNSRDGENVGQERTS